MQELDRFFRSLEGRRVAAAVREEWQQLWGEEFSAMQRFLRPTGELALTYPHHDPDFLYYRVVTHGPDDHVGVCDESGQRVILTTADLVIEELDRLVFHRALGEALGFDPTPTPIEGLQQAVRLGHDTPLAGFRFAVVLIIAQRAVEFQQALDCLAALDDAPFIVVAPTRRFLTPLGEDRLRQRQAAFLALNESVAIDGERLVALPAAKRILESFRQRHLPADTQATETAFFPTPAGSAWSQVKIRLVDGHTASLVVGAARGVFTYAQMGMSNQKNGNPSVQWDLLRTFATGEGVLTWNSPGAHRHNQKRRELLSQCLKRFFRIEGDPILSCGNGWKTRFQICGPA